MTLDDRRLDLPEAVHDDVIVPEADAGVIIAAIEEAFRGVPRGAISIHEAEVIDVYGSQVEQACARKRDAERRWEDVPGESIEACTTALCHVDPTSWRYYIAAYMVWSLRNFRTNNSMTCDATIYTFDRIDDDPKLAAYATERFDHLSEAQSCAVCLFLQHMAKNTDFADDVVADRALRKYWGQFTV